MTLLLNALRLFYLCFAIVYLGIFVYLFLMTGIFQNILWGLAGACFGLLMERLLNHYVHKRKHKRSA
jgi:hypothetical protein